MKARFTDEQIIAMIKEQEAEEVVGRADVRQCHAARHQFKKMVTFVGISTIADPRFEPAGGNQQRLRRTFLFPVRHTAKTSQLKWKPCARLADLCV